jgi:hypothetical protein
MAAGSGTPRPRGKLHPLEEVRRGGVDGTGVGGAHGRGFQKVSAGGGFGDGVFLGFEVGPIADAVFAGAGVPDRTGS